MTLRRKAKGKGKKGKKNIESVPSEAGPDLDGIESECPMSKCRCAGWGEYKENPLRCRGLTIFSGMTPHQIAPYLDELVSDGPCVLHPYGSPALYSQNWLKCPP